MREGNTGSSTCSRFAAVRLGRQKSVQPSAARASLSFALTAAEKRIRARGGRARLRFLRRKKCAPLERVHILIENIELKWSSDGFGGFHGFSFECPRLFFNPFLHFAMIRRERSNINERRFKKTYLSYEYIKILFICRYYT